MPLTRALRIITTLTGTIRTPTVTGTAKMRARLPNFHWAPESRTDLRAKGDTLRNLITGGAGFIGSHLAEALLARGDEVSILDDLSTGGVENIRHLKGNPRFRYYFDGIE